MFYVQHLLGVGHQARAAAITRAMQSHHLDVSYVSGGFAETAHDLGGAKFIQLPPARTADASFTTLLDAAGQPIDAAWEEHRRRALLDAFRTIAPDVLLIESFPFGRRRFRFELLPLLDAAQGHTAIAASVRDILVARNDPERTRWIVETVQNYFDTVIVHGDPKIAVFGDSFTGAAAIAGQIEYSGYVAAHPPLRQRQRSDTVIVSAGGGAVGGPLLRAALAARPLTQRPDVPWRLFTGPNLPKSERIDLITPQGVTIDTFHPNFNGILSEAAVSISQAGYNTVMDLLMTRTRAVLVPFARDGETEQSRRAEIMAERGYFHVVPEADLTPQSLAAAIERAHEAPPPEPATINFNGAAQSAEIIAQLASGR
jgi:predicted glycosyltransferase